MPRRFPCASRIYRILGAHGTGIHEEDGVDEMATDYDAPRRTESDEVSEDSLEELKARRNEAQSAVVDIDETDTAESFELPGADLSGEELGSSCSEAGRRVHVFELLPGSSPQPPGQ